MVESINTKVDLVMKGTSYIGLGSYGQIMIGDKGFEFYSARNVKDYVQIPWTEVSYVVASVIFKGKWIPRFAIKTKSNGTYSFAARDAKKTLRAIRVYVEPKNMVRSLTFFQVITRGSSNIFKKIKNKVGGHRQTKSK
ncbi:DUF956 family protein [Pediococcus inopinatus]|uniref:DUF956 family protein n=1 Tax=Pediococcus inopinatus TaxID=114090 RepID=A0ABZ0Q359_9LACO|nr:DUF956 family protein [Pediococcus inopinatus]AVL00472.1 hypothetical protein PI20285_07375 [Pediococcus inopinatus]KRN61661.1 hypothetical protein IV83_GL000619 [Pediococcus inopinatus]WPC18127.1 DUF956 family protein [Pediococcus inopinatus]WPC19688.1 DUF956 family protein [Pediococcus inopinatus]WPC21384.1 DUF956 family protein [Pediococcus inopinatus]